MTFAQDDLHHFGSVSKGIVVVVQFQGPEDQDNALHYKLCT